MERKQEWDSSFQERKELAEWADTYFLGDETDQFSFATHRKLFDEFNGTKLYFTDRDQLNILLNL